MEKKIYLNDEFDKIWTKIENGENFVLFRYGDGERAVMTGLSVIAQEGWVSPEGISGFGERLLDTLKFSDTNVYYGISCPCCDNDAYHWYSSRIINKNITFANIFVNSNYENFISKFSTLNRDVIFIGNYRAENKNIGNLNILKKYLIDDDCFKFFENEYEKFIKNIINEYGNKKNLLYIVSAGPMSEIIISDLYKNNPKNCYIDFGSSIDKFIHDKQTRPYMDKSTSYAKKICWMYDANKVNFDVSVILTAYKKPQNLRLQLNAIKNQTVKPKEILLFQDGIDEDYTISFNKDLLNEFNNVKICDKNCGVWERFRFAKDNVNSTYVCIFDDDTIPGEKWLENCLTEIHKQDGLYGTIGVVFNKPERYPSCKNKYWFRVGWDGNLNYTAKVDLVGHSWFLKKEWIKYLFENTEEYQNYKIVGEDITLSYKLRQHGIQTFVPPHPANKQELWGSLKKYATRLGSDRNSISTNYKNFNLMNDFMRNIIKSDYKTIKMSDFGYYKKLKRDIFIQKYNLKYLKLSNLFSVKISEDKRHRIITLFGLKIKSNIKND